MQILKQIEALRKQVLPPPIPWVGIRNISDYSPFGVLLPEMTVEGAFYRSGFQGQEHDDEVKGEGNSVNYSYRMHDPRVGRFFVVDPLADQRAWMSPYNFVQNNPIMRIDPDGRLDDWVGCTNEDGTISYHWDENITSEAQAKDLGYDAYKDAGSLITGSLGGGPTGRIFLGTNEAHYLIPQGTSKSATTQLPNPFISNWYNNGSKANAVFGALTSAGGLSNAYLKLTPYFYNNAAAWTPGYKSTPSSVSKTAGILGKVSFFGGVLMDGIGVMNYYTEGADSPNAVHPAKAIVNTGFGYMGLDLNPLAAILYFGVDNFYPGGWTGNAEHEGAIKKMSGLTERNRAIVPNFNLHRDMPGGF